MKRTTLIGLSILMIYHCSLTKSFAQTKIWGAGATIGNAEGRFQTNFTTTGTTGNYDPTTWTALSIYEDGGATLPGNAYWTRSNLGYSQGVNALDSIPMPSPSQSDGLAIFDSDYLNNSGMGSSLSPHKGLLISPRIDLSGYMDSSLLLRFFSQYRIEELTKWTVSMSVDDGTTWSPELALTLLQDSNTAGWVRAYFPTLTTGIATLDSCRIRFLFEGANYYAMIDDLSVELAPDYDLAIARPNPNSTVLAEQGDYIKICNSRYLSTNNLRHSYNDPIARNQWSWGLRAINYGSKSLYPNDSARIILEIDHLTDFGFYTSSIYSDTIYLDNDTLQAGGENSVVGQKTLGNFNFGWYGSGEYIVKYWVEHLHTDAFDDNDTIYHRLNSNRAFAATVACRKQYYESKARLNPNDDKVLATTAVFPKDSTLVSFEYGALFYNPISALGWSGDEIRIDSVDFRYYLPSNYSGDSSLILAVNLYEFVDDGNGWFDKTSELTQIGIGIVHLTGLGTTQALGTYGMATSDVLVDVVTGGSILDLNKGFYMVSIMQYPSLFGNGVLFNDSTGVWFGADNYNYALNTLSTSPTAIIPQSSFLLTRDSLGNSTINPQGFGLGLTPSIGIYSSSSCYIGTKELESTTIDFSIYPTPTDELLNIEVALKEPSTLQYILTDVKGRVLSITTAKSITAEQRTINVQKLTAGTYYLTLKTEKEAVTKPFVKR
ncbi:T9SS type A sorting domain-containing protein [Aureispira anguillae]|uniref:T9SS type A sorting domain-containing protein n=1 Tax=Aureispira anguillae TaxID=2864201 RepID=A0A915YLI1_9BACT|nr:T9SS type A sorting domain-containing protein [Aureispira anguillae]BDS14958.1 T9SS type A sorting domain-containing protein [Aureispira anguillae]